MARSHHHLLGYFEEKVCSQTIISRPYLCNHSFPRFSEKIEVPEIETEISVINITVTRRRKNSKNRKNSLGGKERGQGGKRGRKEKEAMVFFTPDLQGTFFSLQSVPPYVGVKN